MNPLTDYSFSIFDLEGNSRRIRPNIEKDIIMGPFSGGDFVEVERAAYTLYDSQFDFQVKNLNNKLKEPVKYAFGERENHRKSDYITYLPTSVLNVMRNQIVAKIDAELDGDPVSIIERNGLPDLFVIRSLNEGDYCFVEVKKPWEPLLPSQIDWINQFQFLDVKVIYVSNDEAEIKDHYHRFDITEEIG